MATLLSKVHTSLAAKITNTNIQEKAMDAMASDAMNTDAMGPYPHQSERIGAKPKPHDIDDTKCECIQHSFATCSSSQGGHFTNTYSRASVNTVIATQKPGGLLAVTSLATQCMHVCTYVCMHACMYACMCVYAALAS